MTGLVFKVMNGRVHNISTVTVFPKSANKFSPYRQSCCSILRWCQQRAFRLHLLAFHYHQWSAGESPLLQHGWHKVSESTDHLSPIWCKARCSVYCPSPRRPAVHPWIKYPELPAKLSQWLCVTALYPGASSVIARDSRWLIPSISTTAFSWKLTWVLGTLSNPYSIYGALKVRNKADFLENIADLLMMYANTFIVLLMQPAACAYFYVTCLWFFKLCNCAQKNCFAGPGWPETALTAVLIHLRPTFSKNFM